MPFGATPTGDGRVRFRLWAPGARAVELLLGRTATERVERLHALREGWFETVTAGAGPGASYRFRVDGGTAVPDPASRFNPDDVHGASEVIDPEAFVWQDDGWQGRPWEEAVVYELHVGTFSPEGTFAGVERRLDYLAELGVTAIELMPVADFPGRRGWGYDGVLPFAPDAIYGRPDDLKRLVQAAHHRGLMVLLDVVYNHFGPEGNYLYVYARDVFFTDRHRTPWGAGVNFDGQGSEVVRQFFVHNALYWIEEYHLDGLRLDAVQAIADDSPAHLLEAIAEAVRQGPGQTRAVHLVLENDANQARFLARDASGRPRWYDAQWNDDLHHALHVVLTGECDGYYADYADAPLERLGRCLTEGFAYQGERSAYRDGAPRGEPSAHLPPTAFVNFLQTHDQIGNRAFGERLCALASPEAVTAATAIVLLAPSPPLLFMGEEYAAATPFLYFCDFGPELAGAVTAGRREEFARFDRFSDPVIRDAIPDPNDPETFRRSRLAWDCLGRSPHAETLAHHQELLALRRREVAPRLGGQAGGLAGWQTHGGWGLAVTWTLADRSRLSLLANLSSEPHSGVPAPAGRLLYATGVAATTLVSGGALPPWLVAWWLEEPGQREPA
jgi:malto-oligosyltrehalose trehalohydrolase